jgi:DNA-binding beta-propeller fold protein YncE
MSSGSQAPSTRTRSRSKRSRSDESHADAKTSIGVLGPDLLGAIFGHVLHAPPPALAHAARTCKAWHDAANVLLASSSTRLQRTNYVGGTAALKLRLPHAVAQLADGKVVVADTYSGRLVVLAALTNESLQTIPIKYPRGLAVHGNDLFVCGSDSTDGWIYRYRLQAPPPATAPWEILDEAKTVANLYGEFLSAIAVEERRGLLCVACSTPTARRILLLSLHRPVVTTAIEMERHIDVGGLAAHDGLLFVCESTAGRVRVFDTTASHTPTLVRTIQAPDGDRWRGVWVPRGVAVSADVLYVADARFVHALRRRTGASLGSSPSRRPAA